MDAKSEAFFRAIREASREQESAIMADIQQYKAQQLAEARALADKKYEEYVSAAVAGFALEDGIEAEQRAAELKKEVIAVRTDITKSVFDDVHKKLEAFTGTPDYQELLLESAKKMAAFCGNAPITIYLREQDLPFADTIRAVSPTISVSADNTIGLGGLYGVCEEKAVRLNDLLETRLAAQKDWFYEHSGLSL